MTRGWAAFDMSDDGRGGPHRHIATRGQAASTQGTRGVVSGVTPAFSWTRCQKSGPERGRWKARCQAVARKHGLCARETEVFMLLAKGRGIEHIQGRLCISGHTVKSHVYNIYRKMDINSRKELLDAVEDANACN